MNLLAVLGSPRKGKSTDVLLDKVIEGARSADADLSVRKISLIDHVDRLFRTQSWPEDGRAVLVERDIGLWWMDAATGEIIGAVSDD